MAEARRYSGRLAGCRPSLPLVLASPAETLLPREVREQVRDDPPELLLEGIHTAELGRQKRLQLGGEVRPSPFFVSGPEGALHVVEAGRGGPDRVPSSAVRCSATAPQVR